MPVRTKKSRTNLPSPAPQGKIEASQVGAADQAPSPSDTSPATEEHPHLGDWIAFYLWVACFLLMLAMNAYDLLRALINW